MHSNAATASQAWDVGVVLLLVFLQFSWSKITNKDDITRYRRDGQVANNKNIVSLVEEGSINIFPREQLPTVTPSLYVGCFFCLCRISTKKVHQYICSACMASDWVVMMDKVVVVTTVLWVWCVWLSVLPFLSLSFFSCYPCSVWPTVMPVIMSEWYHWTNRKISQVAKLEHYNKITTIESLDLIFPGWRRWMPVTNSNN